MGIQTPVATMENTALHKSPFLENRSIYFLDKGLEWTVHVAGCYEGKLRQITMSPCLLDLFPFANYVFPRELLRQPTANAATIIQVFCPPNKLISFSLGNKRKQTFTTSEFTQKKGEKHQVPETIN